MDYTDRECEIFNDMLHDFESIDSDMMLRERGLEWGDFKYMGIIIDTLRYKKQCYVGSKRIANYFASFGMTVNCYVNECRVQL